LLFIDNHFVVNNVRLCERAKQLMFNTATIRLSCVLNLSAGLPFRKSAAYHYYYHSACYYGGLSPSPRIGVIVTNLKLTVTS